MIEFISGVFSWGLARELIGYFSKRLLNQRKAQIEIVTGDMKRLAERLDFVQGLAYKYYSAAGNDDELSREIKSLVKQVGEGFTSINDGLEMLRKDKMPGYLMISFRQAVTTSLDNNGRKAWSLDCPEVRDISSKTAALTRRLLEYRFDLA